MSVQAPVRPMAHAADPRRSGARRGMTCRTGGRNGVSATAEHRLESGLWLPSGKRIAGAPPSRAARPPDDPGRTNAHRRRRDAPAVPIVTVCPCQAAVHGPSFPVACIRLHHRGSRESDGDTLNPLFRVCAPAVNKKQPLLRGFERDCAARRAARIAGRMTAIRKLPDAAFVLPKLTSRRRQSRCAGAGDGVGGGPHGG